MRDIELPISIKAVLIHEDRVLLVRNDRGEWELPCGRLEVDESPRECVRREVGEETGLECRAVRVVAAECCEVIAEKYVMIVSFGCTVRDPEQPLVVSPEHEQARWWPLADLESITLPGWYRTAITRWLRCSDVMINLA